MRWALDAAIVLAVGLRTLVPCFCCATTGPEAPRT